MQQQQPAQAPIPDHRLDEMARQLRELSNQNQQLRGQIDFMSKQGQQPPPQEESAFEPNVQKALEGMIQKMMSPVVEQSRQQIGLLYDRIDDANYKLQYSGDNFSKYNEKIEQLRNEYQNKGQWISREDALRIAYFEDTGRKPQAKPPEAQKQEPKWDPYLGTFVDETGKPAAPVVQTTDHNDGFAPGEIPQQMPPQQMPQQYPQQGQMPPQQMPQQMQPGQQFAPQGQPNYNLPQQSVHQQAAPAHNQQGHINLDLVSGDPALDAWADKYGDIPL